MRSRKEIINMFSLPLSLGIALWGVAVGCGERRPLCVCAVCAKCKKEGDPMISIVASFFSSTNEGQLRRLPRAIKANAKMPYENPSARIIHLVWGSAEIGVNGKAALGGEQAVNTHINWEDDGTKPGRSTWGWQQGPTHEHADHWHCRLLKTGSGFHVWKKNRWESSGVRHGLHVCCVAWDTTSSHREAEGVCKAAINQLPYFQVGVRGNIITSVKNKKVAKRVGRVGEGCKGEVNLSWYLIKKNYKKGTHERNHHASTPP